MQQMPIKGIRKCVYSLKDTMYINLRGIRYSIQCMTIARQLARRTSLPYVWAEIESSLALGPVTSHYRWRDERKIVIPLHTISCTCIKHIPSK